ncbi:MAG TPA: hypothetical protein VJN67_15215 [Stellaceae bacterium]|nr:hypothetical protein [Stellaceae bacterium]
MLEFLHWSAALFALLGLALWFWSAHSIGRFKRPMRRVAICAAVASALIQAETPTPPTQSSNVELWASAATVSPIV